jgi:hypothetical protein
LASSLFVRGLSWSTAVQECFCALVLCFLSCFFCDASSVAVSPSVVVAVGNIALSAIGVMPPCGVRARVYPDPAVLGARAGLGENIVSITLLPQTRNGHDGTARR